MFYKPIDQITEADIQTLIDEKVLESKKIEYKRELPGSAPKGKIEFLKDVSSFANASGGHLIFGIKEKDGLPYEICGIQVENFDQTKQQFENSLRNNIKPRIPGITIHSVSLHTSGIVILIYIPHSWARPHVVERDRHWRFYSRNSAGVYPLDVSELKAAFLMSETFADRLRDFRSVRLGNIVAGETPIPLGDSPKTVLHIVPIRAFDTLEKFDLTSLDFGESDLFKGPEGRYNLDGYLRYRAFREGVPGKYLQIFRNGIIEGVGTLTMNNSKIPSDIFEYEHIEAFSQCLNIQKQLGTESPIFIMYSLLGVKDFYNVQFIGC